MGKVKNFACWLSECVYRGEMTDEDIIEAVKSLSNEKNKEVDNEWMLDQINHVLNNPHIYNVLVE